MHCTHVDRNNSRLSGMFDLACYNYVVIVTGFANCMFEASRCCAERFAKGGRGSMVTNRE